MQSQCPQCHTAFRVSEEQLALADGKVRCGQCMHVFIASEHFIDVAPTEMPEPPVTDEITLSAVDIELEAKELDLPEALSIDDLNPADIDMAEIEIADIEIPSLEALDEYSDAHETEDENETSIKSLAETPAEVLISEETSGQPLPDIQNHVVHSITESMAAANETWQEDDARHDEEVLSEQNEAATETVKDVEPEIESDEQTASSIEEPHTGDLDSDDTDEAIPLLVDSFDASQLYPELDVAPVVEQARHTGLYSIAVIILLVTFSLQGIYALRDTLANQPKLRPLMSDFCATFDCAITLPREPEKIVLTRSEVRSHSAQTGALLVKASMQNQARFRQAYPLLRLQFSDLDGHSLIGRDFLPEEYLPDDVNIEAGMPINTDINLSLELLDPGAEAVSFDFNLL